MEYCSSLRKSLALVLLFIAPIALLAPSVRAQDASDEPPAMAIAHRLLNEANVANALAARYYAVNQQPDAGLHHDIAHRRAFQAAAKIAEIPTSAEYKNTHWAPEALALHAAIETDYLRNLDAAVLSYKALLNTYRQTNYAGKDVAMQRWLQLRTAVDYRNAHKFPGSILYNIINSLVNLTGAKPYSYAIAIVLISVIIKLALTPLSNKQYQSMQEMHKLQPLVKELQAKHKNDKELQTKKVMELYKEHGVNPAGGCVPMVVQLPILIMLYQGIRLYEFKFSHGTFLWIGSHLSHQYPAQLATDLGQQDIPLLLMYAISMYFQQKMMVPSDPQQAEQQKMMAIMTPFMSTYFFLQWHLPSAFVLYYLVFNLLSMSQQKYYMKKRAGHGPLPVMLIEPTAPNENGFLRRLSKPAARMHVDSNSATPTARGVIAPRAKVHPKKKKR